MIAKKILLLVENYSQKLKESGIPIKAIFLFGSVVKGTMHKGSDIDICVVSPMFGANRLEERLRLMKLQKGLTDLIEPHPYSPKDFDSKFDPLSLEIKKTGIRII